MHQRVIEAHLATSLIMINIFYFNHKVWSYLSCSEKFQVIINICIVLQLHLKLFAGSPHITIVDFTKTQGVRLISLGVPKGQLNYTYRVAVTNLYKVFIEQLKEY